MRWWRWGCKCRRGPKATLDTCMGKIEGNATAVAKLAVEMQIQTPYHHAKMQCASLHQRTVGMPLHETGGVLGSEVWSEGMTRPCALQATAMRGRGGRGGGRGSGRQARSGGSTPAAQTAARSKASQGAHKLMLQHACILWNDMPQLLCRICVAMFGGELAPPALMTACSKASQGTL